MIAREVNFDGIVGPTHNYAGLAFGNLASERSARIVSDPKAAAKQGLQKMKRLVDLGVPQAVLPPHDRPAVRVLRSLGFAGTDEEVLRRAGAQEPRVLAACASASGMWAANAATVCPSSDSSDGTVHFTPANLHTHFHRQLEASMTARILQTIFHDPTSFTHHDPLPSTDLFGDEGAANHTRLCAHYGDKGMQLFVFGCRVLEPSSPRPARFPARQTFEASLALCRLHGLDERRVVFAQQRPSAIDAGAFHNDVVAVGNRHVFVFHQDAFLEAQSLVEALRDRSETELEPIEVCADEISIDEAISSYLFNSQLVTLPQGEMALVVPAEVRESARAFDCLERVVERSASIVRVEVVDVRQSMRNGGGPACLRLRVVLTEEEFCHLSGSVVLDDRLFHTLDAWIERHYRDRLVPRELCDPRLLDESRAALDELTQILGLGSLYDFQRDPSWPAAGAGNP